MASPSSLGWFVVQRRDGEPIRWFHPSKGVALGTMRGGQHTYLDVRGDMEVWLRTSPYELALALEVGVASPPDMVCARDSSMGALG